VDTHNEQIYTTILELLHFSESGRMSAGRDSSEEEDSDQNGVDGLSVAISSEHNPYPSKQLLILAFCRLSEPIAMTSSFPYLYFMIRDFHVVEDEKAIARYAGILASCFSFSQVFSGNIH
jgi:hypothetical protein